jgi:hypothetical protein
VPRSHSGTCPCHRLRPLFDRRFAKQICRENDDAAVFLIGGDLAKQVRQHGGVPHIATCQLDCPDLQLLLIHTGMDLSLISWDHAAHNPVGYWMRRFGPPCLRAFHSSSPSALIPVMSFTRRGIPLECPESAAAGAVAPPSLCKQ